MCEEGLRGQVTVCVKNGARGLVSARVVNGFERWAKLRECGMSDMRVCVCVRRVCVVNSIKDLVMKCAMVGTVGTMEKLECW